VNRTLRESYPRLIVVPALYRDTYCHWPFTENFTEGSHELIITNNSIISEREEKLTSTFLDRYRSEEG